ncbi:hypothetical protein ACLQ2R_34175 [Streptosporangium sp. DT93]|uniref:hypothetical protein n=1 Tax=Streptosporangium sp. DT93 TaxID=3393428 RepID=UPI003CEB6C51
MHEHNGLSAEAALREVDRAQGTVRKSDRRGAYFFLGMWLAVTGYWLIRLLGPATVMTYATVALGVTVVTGLLHASRQRVYGRLHSRLSYTVTCAFMGTTVAGTLYVMFLHPQEPGAPRTVAGVLVALIASAPLLYGAVRMLRSPEHR